MTFIQRGARPCPCLLAAAVSDFISNRTRLRDGVPNLRVAFGVHPRSIHLTPRRTTFTTVSSPCRRCCGGIRCLIHETTARCVLVIRTDVPVAYRCPCRARTNHSVDSATNKLAVARRRLAVLEPPSHAVGVPLFPGEASSRGCGVGRPAGRPSRPRCPCAACRAARQRRMRPQDSAAQSWLSPLSACITGSGGDLRPKLKAVGANGGDM